MIRVLKNGLSQMGQLELVRPFVPPVNIRMVSGFLTLEDENTLVSVLSCNTKGLSECSEATHK